MIAPRLVSHHTVMLDTKDETKELRVQQCLSSHILASGGCYWKGNGIVLLFLKDSQCLIALFCIFFSLSDS